ncbi:metallo-beta-lactamase domain-containing protein 1 [Contarinia nasturtii]|uniref:metallo-beta-lactamase domain-containing protein 1 n=1 Tax=Contarinia nasturtii TaxID=265458 RepID=UPI0012D44925|nr:metallo-beta-lactamase domain-containing protein 1 [Contarinia nasturtii]XP_031623218.1 metallo-beta-lactamase domain-containing protein 1 [Contarinia nasturtii]
MHRNKVIVLFDGYSKTVNSTTTLANCTCTLVKGKNSCIIVDTRTSWDGNEIIDALQNHGINVNDITHVVCTHGHSDHIGCNYLFLKAKEHIVGHAISNKDEYRYTFDNTTTYAIDEGIFIMSTPGHTLDSITLIVENSDLSENSVAICGDLFEKREDIDDETHWTSVGSDDINQQRKNRQIIAEMSGIIIPGHGPKFDVTPEIRSKLKEQERIEKSS